ncbi:MAG: glycerophosphodiester phosphodiesterase [Acidimicrobiia bacterium]|nr:glycerophosphodiester phosphodiesterase [bacterium]MXZ07625.1 glycerophosphodiester phosphodiesterase [Acidimicrobiia bacterium]MYH55462.1 glycerophosphodiester phosphodiesterase [Acidimicrobiia bacterium]
MAHRGSGLLWPENTMVAFQGAVELGYRYLETDLQITKDGVLVTIHDPTVDRTTDGSGRVSDFTLAELQNLDAGYRFEQNGEYPYRGRDIRIPTLEELATTFLHCLFTLDLKSNGMEEPLVALIDRLDLWERVIVGSFSSARLRRFRSLTDGRAATSAGPAEILRFVGAVRSHLPFRPRADSFQVPVKDRGVTIVNPATVKRARELGIPLIVWTVNDPTEMEELLAMGVDGLITDRPDLLRYLLTGRKGTPWEGDQA